MFSKYKQKAGKVVLKKILKLPSCYVVYLYIVSLDVVCNYFVTDWSDFLSHVHVLSMYAFKGFDLYLYNKL